MPNYFNEEYVIGMAKDYLSYPEETRFTEAAHLRQEIMREASNVIDAIIFKHRFMKYRVPFEDLKSHAWEACLEALERFDPNYVIPSTGQPVKIFNYFSLVAKRSLIYMTMADKKHRDVYSMTKYTEDGEITEHEVEALTHIDADTELVKEDLYKEIKRVLPTKYQLQGKLLVAYLQLFGKFNKRDFYSYAESYGVSKHLLRNFIKELRENADDIRKSLGY